MLASWIVREWVAISIDPEWVTGGIIMKLTTEMTGTAREIVEIEIAAAGVETGVGGAIVAETETSIVGVEIAVQIEIATAGVGIGVEIATAVAGATEAGNEIAVVEVEIAAKAAVLEAAGTLLGPETEMILIEALTGNEQGTKWIDQNVRVKTVPAVLVTVSALKNWRRRGVQSLRKKLISRNLDLDAARIDLKWAESWMNPKILIWEWAEVGIDLEWTVSWIVPKTWIDPNWVETWIETSVTILGNKWRRERWNLKSEDRVFSVISHPA